MGLLIGLPILAPSSMSRSAEDILTNTARPPTDATLTVRIIKSLRFRTEKSLVLHNVDLTSTTVGQLKSAATQGKPSSLGASSAHIPQPSHPNPAGSRIAHASLVGPILQPSHPIYPPPDTLKLYTKAHGAKVSLRPCPGTCFLTSFRHLTLSSIWITMIGSSTMMTKPSQK